jgi:CBS domain-containing protein
LQHRDESTEDAMNSEIRDYLAAMPYFAMLPAAELDQLASQARPQVFAKGVHLAIQGKTRLSHIYVVKRGTIAVYNEKDNARLPDGFIQEGELFGGVALLVNAGVSPRTLHVDRETEAYLIPQEKFLELCVRYKDFYAFIVEKYEQREADSGLDGHIGPGQAKILLSGIAPFSFLHEDALEQAAEALSTAYHAKGAVLFFQGLTRVEHLYILHKGSVEKYYEQNGRKTLSEVSGEGDLFGGISMLLNNGLAVRTMEVTEDANFYLLPKEVFLRICKGHAAFADFFTDTFGKRMLNRSYAAIIARTSIPPQESLQLFNQPVHQLYNRATVFGAPAMTIQQVAERMKQENSSYLILPPAEPQPAGIITESDLTRKVIAAGYDIGRPAVEVMSVPLHTIGENAIVFEALMQMMQHNVKHLAVTDGEHQIIGVLSNRELISAQGRSPLFLLREISRAESLDEILVQHRRLPGIVKGLISSGASARNINRVITAVSDGILKKIMEIVMLEMAPPPTSFAFMIMGSEGRGEQTLKTDQDNAIVFEDVSEADLPEVSQYFLELGQRVCTLLDQAGYAFCQGDVMAQNPNWCQPLSTWMKYFLKWIHAAEGEDLLQASIFFDFRYGFGDIQLVEALRDHLHGAIGRWTGFLRYMTENALHFKPPLGFFRNFVVESKGKHRDALDIKSAMTPIVDFARIYALKNGIQATNTFERLHQLFINHVLNKEEYEEIEKAYSFLMQLRFVRQVTASIEQKLPPDNFINPKRMTRIEQTMLKEIFKRIEKFQAKMNFEFIGIA